MKNKKLDDEYYQLLEQIQTADFVLVELTHYLDTHPNDKQALKQFNQFHEYSQQLKAAFEPKYGPLLGFGNNLGGENTWEWGRGPWPWQV